MKSLINFIHLSKILNFILSNQLSKNPCIDKNKIKIKTSAVSSESSTSAEIQAAILYAVLLLL